MVKAQVSRTRKVPVVTKRHTGTVQMPSVRSIEAKVSGGNLINLDCGKASVCVVSGKPTKAMYGVLGATPWDGNVGLAERPS